MFCRYSNEYEDIVIRSFENEETLYFITRNVLWENEDDSSKAIRLCKMVLTKEKSIDLAKQILNHYGVTEL